MRSMTRLLLQLLLLFASCQAVAATTESGRGQRDMLRDGREELRPTPTATSTRC